MYIHNISEQHSVLNNFLFEIRDEIIQHDAMRFRRNIERIGEILAYELSKYLHYEMQNVTTPLGIKEIYRYTQNLVICGILRAGLPLQQGLLNYFDRAENAFISAFRNETNEGDFSIVVEYLATPSLEDKTLILADPMLATGRSIINTYEVLLQKGTPNELHVVSVIASEEGIDYISKSLPENSHLWVASVDKVLNKKGYIIPGLGDAGDLAFGKKL